jgi:hypothetical protein
VRLDGLTLADDAVTWEALGFRVAAGVVGLGGVALSLAGRAAGTGILGWAVAGLDSDLLPRLPAADARDDTHPNGALAVDHVVALAHDFDAASAELAAAGLEARRIREVPGGPDKPASGRRQAFYVLDTALLELVGPAKDVEGLRFWGLTLVVSDLDALSARLGPLLGPVKDAVQPGRRIATARREAGSSVPLAFMTPRAAG